MSLYLKELLLFAISLAFVRYYHWNTTDLIWSFWSASFIIGYLTILYYAFYLPLQILKTYKSNEPDREKLKKKIKLEKPYQLIFVLILSSLPGILFIIPFFTIHFGGFHSVHAQFLQDFAPIPDLMIENPPVLHYIPFFDQFPDLAKLVQTYWPIIIAAGVNEFLQSSLKQPHSKKEKSSKQKPKDFMMKPYANVFKLHILIFIMGGAQFLGISGFGLYALVFTVFFFPFKIIFGKSSQTLQ